MKRIFTFAFAAIALVACNKENTVEVAEGSAIAFDQVFVDNATKATDLTKANLKEFGVFGAVELTDQSGKLFNNERVYWNGNKFAYDNIQYWIPSAQYYFTAIAPYQTGTDAAWTYATDEAQNGTISYNASKDLDLLFSYVKPAATAATISVQPDAVAFTFKHMLSRARFTFVNTIPAASNITMRITEVKINDAYQNGKIAITKGVDENWTVADDATYVVNFANAANVIPAAATGVVNYETTEHHYILPVAKKLNVTFKVEIIQAGVSLGVYDRETTIDITPAKGMSYDIKANLTAENALPNALYPIEFSVNKIEDWAEYSSIETAPIK